MPLSQADRIKISGEMLDLPLKIAAANATAAELAGVKTDLQNQDASLKIFFDKYNDIANAYQVERQWIDGTTYTTVTNVDLDTAAQRQPGNKFFPTDGSWTKFQPKKHASSEGLPTTITGLYELLVFSDTISNGGLTVLLDFLLNGQTSGVANDTLSAPYVNGSGTLMVTTGGQTPGKLIILKDTGGVSALFLVVSATTPTNLTVSELIPANGSLTATATVKENITAFTNTERNTLISTDYQNVLTTLTTKIKTSVDNWKTALDAQLAQLNLNGDSRSPQASEITSAKADVNSAISVITTWKALPDTGTTLTDSKFVNVNITPLQNKVTSRTSGASTRATQITTALGSVTQNPDGTYSGSGIYYLRYVQIDSRINLAGGPLTEFYEKDLAGAALGAIVSTSNNKGATFSSELKVTKIAQNANGTMVIKVGDATGFSTSDTVFVVGDSLTELTGTITGINGVMVSLSFVVPNTYTTDTRARLYKQL